MARTAGAIVAVLLVVVALGWLFQRRLVYLPAGPPPPVADVLPEGEAVTLSTSDDLELEAWFVEAGPTAVLVFPGNAGNRAARAPLARALTAEGLSVLLVDYRGYGGNPGTPTEEGLRLDAQAAAAWAQGRAGIQDLVYLGESLGSGVAAWLATRQPPAALVLRSPIPSLGAIARVHYGPVPDVFLRDRFDVLEAIGRTQVPVLVVVGGDDAIVPPPLSRQVHEAAGDRSELVSVPGAGHNDLALLAGDRVVAAVVEFIDRHAHGSNTVPRSAPSS